MDWVTGGALETVLALDVLQPGDEIRFRSDNSLPDAWHASVATLVKQTGPRAWDVVFTAAPNDIGGVRGIVRKDTWHWVNPNQIDGWRRPLKDTPK